MSRLARARKRAHRNLVEGLSPQTIAGLEAMLVVTDDEDRTPLAWLRAAIAITCSRLDSTSTRSGPDTRSAKFHPADDEFLSPSG